MPYTLSHPLAVVPLRRWCPERRSFAALVVGSMSPDFGYFVNQFPAAAFAHSLPGTFLICVPTGLAVLGFFYLVRRPLCFVLPEPHRDALTRLAMAHRRLSIRELVVAAISVLLGAWTHTIWDSFTHSYGWPVHQIGCLHSQLGQIGSKEIFGYTLLQHLSTIIGGSGLILFYYLWLRRQPRSQAAETNRFRRFCAIYSAARSRCPRSSSRSLRRIGKLTQSKTKTRSTASHFGQPSTRFRRSSRCSPSPRSRRTSPRKSNLSLFAGYDNSPELVRPDRFNLGKPCVAQVVNLRFNRLKTIIATPLWLAESYDVAVMPLVERRAERCGILPSAMARLMCTDHSLNSARSSPSSAGRNSSPLMNTPPGASASKQR